MAGLASLYSLRDEPDRAEPLAAKALEASLKTRGERDVDTVKLLKGLGDIYTHLGRYAESERLLLKALDGHLALLGDRHPDTLSARSVLSVLYLHMGRLADAERYASETFRMRRIVLGEHHPMTLTSQGILTCVFLAQARRADADPLLRGFREKVHQQQDRLPPFTIWRIGLVGHALLQLKDFTEAESFLRLYLELARRKHPDGWRRSAAEAALGACLLAQKKYSEAEPLLRKGYHELRQREQTMHEGFGRVRPLEALEWLVRLYEESGKPNEAAKWRKDLEDALHASGSGTPKS
jgi:tetratricopeptide (TPR) repeat protein